MDVNSDLRQRPAARPVARAARLNWTRLGALLAGLSTSALFWTWLIGLVVRH